MRCGSYQFYVDEWGGSLSESEFNRLYGRAWALLNSMTHGRLATCWDSFTDGEKSSIYMALASMIDSVASAEKTRGRNVLLEIVGQHHVSYSEPKASGGYTARVDVSPYLEGINCRGVPLMFRGYRRRCSPC